MLRQLAARIRQGYRTMPYPKGTPVLPDRFRGKPEIDRSACAADCRACAAACPTSAVTFDGGGATLDLGRCLFCADCAATCPTGALRFTGEHRLAAWGREDLLLRSPQPAHAETQRRRGAEGGREDLLLRCPQPAPTTPADDARLRLFRRSLKLRQVSAGGCNACEADVNVLCTVAFDIGRFGIQLVASPRHADGLLITGPVTENMQLALEKTYKALPPPRLVIAVGACAISGGPFSDHPEVKNGAAGIVPVDLFIPGCPPHPLTILDGLLRLVGRIDAEGREESA